MLDTWVQIRFTLLILRSLYDMAKEEVHTLSVSTDKYPQTSVEEVKKVAEENDATFSGNENSEAFPAREPEASTR